MGSGEEGKTHRAEGLELLVGHEAAVQAEEEDGGVGQQASQDDQVVHVGAGHLDQPVGKFTHTCLHKPKHDIPPPLPLAPPTATLSSPVVSVLDVEEEEGAGHQHAQDGDGGQDAVERHVDVAPLQTHKGAVLGWLHPCGRKQEVTFGFPHLLQEPARRRTETSIPIHTRLSPPCPRLNPAPLEAPPPCSQSMVRALSDGLAAVGKSVETSILEEGGGKEGWTGGASRGTRPISKCVNTEGEAAQGGAEGGWKLER